MPVIKADAYGHGVVAVARVLAEEGIQHMAVGSVGEGALLRQEGHTAFLLALMGLARDEDTALAASYDITPLVHSRESLGADPCAKPSDGTGEAVDGCHQIRHRHVPAGVPRG